uniref:dUTP diphosphatase n=1 Tax=Populus trichocarpa TaxID=3694 RepID=A0A2K1XXZ2_POPTR
MPQAELRNNSPEIKETSHKIPKLQQNGLSESAALPSRCSLLAAGCDISSALETEVPARGKALIPTYLSIAKSHFIPFNLSPRSGLAWKHSIDVGAGVIDADYRGPIGVITLILISR